MHSFATVHLLSTAGRFGGMLSRALKPTVAARLWAAAPPANEVQPGDVVVVDLTDRHAVNPHLLQPLLGRATLCLLPGDAPISPHWLDLASQAKVHVLTASAGHLEDVVTGLRRLIQGPGGSRVTELVLRAEPALQPVEALVEAVCLDPWAIRRPRELALRSGMTLGAVRRLCADMGFNRIEHFIICVRLLAYSELVATEHLPVRTARALVGFDDPSNMRRHARRAALHSPIVERALVHSLQRHHETPLEPPEVG